MIRRLTLQIAVFFLILLTAGESSGQDLQITYKVKVDNLYNTSRPDTLPSSVREMFQKAGENFKFLKYTLNIKDDKSLFFMNEGVLNDAEHNPRLTIALAGVHGMIFTSAAENLLLQETDTYGQEFLISSEFDVIDWIITGETKMIGNLKTFRATASETYQADGERKTWQFTAWFAPQINRQFGPLGFGNLPGLIVELSRAGKTYTISDINETRLSSEAVAKPTEGKQVNRKEFEEIGSRMAERMKRY